MAGRTVVVTGATGGLGRATAVEMARRGGRLILTTRSAPRADRLLHDLDVLGHEAQAVELDLGSCESIVAAADRIAAMGRIHVLVNNAGIAWGRGVTADGFERTVAVNYVGPFLLTRRLLPSMAGGGRPRVVNVASHAHHRAAEIDFRRMLSRTRSLTGLPEYALSKLAMVLWGRELATRHPGVDVYTVHPGMVMTPMWGRVPQPVRWWLGRRMISPEEGARTQVACAADPGLEGMTGRYWSKGRPTLPSEAGRDDGMAARLWEWTETELAARGV